MRILTTLFAAALAMAGTMLAQSTTDRINAHFSTPVVAGGSTLPAGDYTIQVLRGSSDNIILVLRSESGAAVSVSANRFTDSSAATSDRVNLVLVRHGGAYQLDSILFPDRTGFQLIP
jgi:hypothetical protein